jgi:lipoyl(octanoyl) transferase
MRVLEWGEIEYYAARERMGAVHANVVQTQENHLIICSHPNVFTIGQDAKEEFNVATVQSDRGGSITCHTLGQSVFYFCFVVDNPARFYKKVVRAFEAFFQRYLPAVKYDKKQPGFYIQNRKIASLGFRYSQGVSLHGVALNVDVDLAFHSQVNPCNLERIVPTSLANEGMDLNQKEIERFMIDAIKKSFDAV